MTEQEWLECADPGPMLELLRIGIVRLVDDLPTPTAREDIRQFLLGRAVSRKRALFACACCRRSWDLLKDDRSKKAVEVAERSIDGLASDKELAKAQVEAMEARDAVGVTRKGEDRAAVHIARVAAHAVWGAVCLAVENATIEFAEVESWSGITPTLSDAKARQTVLLRDIFGNPFRPVTAEPSWLTSTVVSLATAIYEDRAFDRLPILADALEDAGCTNADILNHCREPGDHVRGCWLVDLILSKDR